MIEKQHRMATHAARLLPSVLASTLLILAFAPAFAQDKPLNFLMIWGDDIGYWNLSAYNQGMMG